MPAVATYTNLRNVRIATSLAREHRRRDADDAEAKVTSHGATLCNQLTKNCARKGGCPLTPARGRDFGFYVVGVSCCEGHLARGDSNIASIDSSASPIFVGDMSAYHIRQVGNVRLARSDDFAFTKRQTVIRAMMRTDATLVDSTAVNQLHMAVT